MVKSDERRTLKRGEGSWFERNGKFVARWHDGVKMRGRTFDDAEAAEDHIRTMNRKRRAGKRIAVSDMTIADLMEDYLERSESRLTERTVLNYRQRYEAMIEPYLGSKRIVAIEALDVQEWVTKINKRYQAATVNNAMSVLTAAMGEAVVLGLIDRNPTQGIRRPTIVRDRYTVWSEAECGRFLATVHGHAEYRDTFSALYHTAIVTGMRPGELRALKWDCVDLERGSITIRRTISRNLDGHEIIRESTKTSLIRAVAITPDLVDILTWHRERQDARRSDHGSWQDHGIVFDRGDGHWLYQSSWQRAHIVLVELADVPYINAHALRHTSASLELDAGTHPVIVADRLGHKDVSMTTNMYQHTSTVLQQAAAEALSSRLFGAKIAANSHSNSHSAEKEAPER